VNKTMQTDLQHELEQLGFTERQASVYLALLRFGKSGAQQLSVVLGVPRASCYDALQQLIRQGLATAVTDNHQQYFLAAPPERIGMLLAMQLEETQRRRQQAEAFLPKLTALAASTSTKPRIRLITDPKELRALHQEMLDIHRPFLQLIGFDAYRRLYPETTRTKHASQLQRRQAHGRAILISDEPIDAPWQTDILVRCLPTALLPSVDGEMTVCGDYTYLFAFTQDLAAIEIVSATVAKVCTASLELAWQQAGVIEKQLAGQLLA
jgi:predicted transcriptional regulator